MIAERASDDRHRDASTIMVPVQVCGTERNLPDKRDGNNVGALVRRGYPLSSGPLFAGEASALRRVIPTLPPPSAPGIPRVRFCCISSYFFPWGNSYFDAAILGIMEQTQKV
jgi:hypothetical protein